MSDKVKNKFNLTKGEKVAIIITAILVVLTALWFVIKFAVMPSVSFSNDGKTAGLSDNTVKVADVLFSKNREIELKDGTKQKFSLKYNKDYKWDKDKLFLEQLDCFYVYPKDGKKDTPMTSTEKIGGSTALDIVNNYLGDALMTFNKIVRFFNNLIIFLAILDLIMLIRVYYMFWSRSYDKKLEREKMLQELDTERRKGLSEEEARKRPPTVRPQQKKQRSRKSTKKKKKR